MPMTWNDRADARLLVGLLHTSTPKIDYPGLAEWMGPECTEIAVRRRIQRLKEQVNGNSPNASGADASTGDSPAVATPEKRKRGGKGATKAKAKDGEGKGPPAKKPKPEEGMDEASDAAEGA